MNVPAPRGADAASEPGWRRMVAVATTAPYSWYLLGEVADTLGVWMQRLALGWLVWQLTRSPAWLGILSFLKFAPTIALGLVGGVLADRMSRRVLVIGMQAIAVLKAVLITVLLWSGDLSIGILVVVELVIGTGIALSQAASRTLVNDLVPSADRLSSAIALDSVVFNVSTMIGPAIAGAVMLAFDLTTCFAVIAVLTTVHLVILFVVVPDRDVTAAKQESMVEAIVTATRYALAHPGIGPMLALHLAFTLCARPLIEMLPAYAGGVLHAGVDAVSLLTSAVGAGAIVSGLWLASRRSHLGLTRVVLRGMFWMGLAMIAFAFAPNLAVAASLALAIGGGMTVRAAGIQTLIQLAAADHLRGRVLSFYGLVLNGGVALGAALMGALAEAIGLRWAIFAMSLISLAIWAAVMMRRREIQASLEPA